MSRGYYYFRTWSDVNKVNPEDEQAILDEHDNKVADATARIQHRLAEKPKP